MTYKSVSGGDPDESFRRLPERLMLQAPDALLRAGLILEANWKNILLTPGTGRVYGKRKHRASAPGEPPAPDFGTLQRSITHEVGSASIGGRGRLGSGIAATVRVGTNVEYAEPLEYGTTTAGKNHNVVILPRPHARPAGAASKDQMTDAVVATLKRGNARAD